MSEITRLKLHDWLKWEWYVVTVVYPREKHILSYRTECKERVWRRWMQDVTRWCSLGRSITKQENTTHQLQILTRYTRRFKPLCNKLRSNNHLPTNTMSRHQAINSKTSSKQQGRGDWERITHCDLRDNHYCLLRATSPDQTTNYLHTYKGLYKLPL